MITLHSNVKDQTTGRFPVIAILTLAEYCAMPAGELINLLRAGGAK